MKKKPYFNKKPLKSSDLYKIIFSSVSSVKMYKSRERKASSDNWAEFAFWLTASQN